MHYIVFLYGLMDDKAMRPRPVETNDIELIDIPNCAFGFYFVDADDRRVSPVYIFEDGACYHGLGPDEVPVPRPNQKISA